MSEGELFGAATVQEGRNRFDKGPPPATLFESSEAQDVDAKRYKTQEFFPTPPWAVRAIMEQFLRWTVDARNMRVLEPAAGRGHMVEPLRQLGFQVSAFDLYDYGKGYGRMDFRRAESEAFQALFADQFDLVMTNPPFADAVTFVENGLLVAPDVLLLCRLGFLCSAGRHALHRSNLEAVYICTERVPMVLGRYDPQASTATEYAWFHFKREADPLSNPAVIHIPPGSRARLERPEDVRI